MAKDYVATRKPRKKAGNKKDAGGPTGAYFVKLSLFLILAVGLLGGFFYYRYNVKKPAEKPAAESPAAQNDPLSAKKPARDPYTYRRLLESSEVKTDTAEQKRRNEQSYESRKRPEVVLDPRRKPESRAEEAARAQAILNGSMNTPRDDVTTTVRISGNDQFVVLDGNGSATSRQTQAPRRATSAEIEGTAGGSDHRNGTAPASGRTGTAPAVSPRTVTVAQNNARSPASSSTSAAPAARTPAASNAGESRTVAQPQPARSSADSTRKSQESRDAAAQKPAAGQFYAQCGAFRRTDQADSLRRKIASKGYQSSLSKADVKGVTWYRVILGPYTAKSTVQDVISKLKSSRVVDNCNIFHR